MTSTTKGNIMRMKHYSILPLLLLPGLRCNPYSTPEEVTPAPAVAPAHEVEVPDLLAEVDGKLIPLPMACLQGDFPTSAPCQELILDTHEVTGDPDLRLFEDGSATGYGCIIPDMGCSGAPLEVGN